MVAVADLLVSTLEIALISIVSFASAEEIFK
jgi:hypothetical protein